MAVAPVARIDDSLLGLAHPDATLGIVPYKGGVGVGVDVNTRLLDVEANGVYFALGHELGHAFSEKVANTIGLLAVDGARGAIKWSADYRDFAATHLPKVWSRFGLIPTGEPAAFVDSVVTITPDRLRDGDLGFVERGVLPAEFDQAIFKLPRVGSINPTNKPVKTQIGYHLFRLEGRKPSTNLTFKEAVPMIRGILTEEKQPVAFQAWIQELRDRATIRINRKLLEAGMG